MSYAAHSDTVPGTNVITEMKKKWKMLDYSEPQSQFRLCENFHDTAYSFDRWRPADGCLIFSSITVIF